MFCFRELHLLLVGLFNSGIQFFFIFWSWDSFARVGYQKRQFVTDPALLIKICSMYKTVGLLSLH